MKQSSMNKYVSSSPLRLQDYKIKSNEWMGKTSAVTSPVSTRARSNRQKKKSKQISSTNNTTTSPLHSWLQKKPKQQNNSSNSSEEKSRYNPLQIEAKDKRIGEKSEKRSFNKNDSFEKYGIVFPTADDILENKEKLKREAKLLDDYDNLVDQMDTTITDSLKSLLDSKEEDPPVPLLDCKHLSESQLDHYFSKHSEYLSNILKGIEVSKRHQTYQNQCKRSKLTYSYSTIVFTQSQLDYLINKIEAELDSEGDHTQYLFMVWLPELCMKIFMDLHEMNEKEATDYLNEMPVD